MTRIAITIIAVAASTVAAAEPLPVPKVGTCPPGYRESGGYCAAISPRSLDAVPKRGQCPSGSASGASYCTRMPPR
jgi:hypothetical protein